MCSSSTSQVAQHLSPGNRLPSARGTAVLVLLRDISDAQGATSLKGRLEVLQTTSCSPVATALISELGLPELSG